MFDPYSQWLGIPENERPVSCVRLLGLSESKIDPQTIVFAAITQADRVRAHQSGPHAKTCRRLLKQIDLAKEALLNPSRRPEYDAFQDTVLASEDDSAEAAAIGTPEGNGYAEPSTGPSAAISGRKKKSTTRGGQKKAGGGKGLVIVFAV